MVRGRSAAAPNPTLQNVKWRFLSDAALGPTVRPQAYPDDSKKRISHLEKALASTHDLEAQYQSFLQEVSKIDPSGTTFDGIGPGWAGVPSLGPAGGASALAASSADIIPSDPPDEPNFDAGGRVGRAGGIGMGSFTSRSSVTGAPDAGAASAGDEGASGAPGTSGEFAAEDEEVARVQKLAAQAAAEENDDPLRNSPSPVIIWRHAAPVKIATNVPADLLVGHGAESPTSPTSPVGGLPLSLGGGGERPRLGGGRAPPQPRFVNPARAAYDRRMAYGVWYLPRDQWEQRAQAAAEGGLASAALGDPTVRRGKEASASGGEAGTADGKAARKGGGGHGRREKGGAASKDKGGAAGGGGSGDEGEGQSLADQIPTLYSSRIYKDFLKAQKIPANRIPPYLQRVESPKETPKASLASRGDRGKIPMMEGGEQD